MGYTRKTTFGQLREGDFFAFEKGTEDIALICFKDTDVQKDYRGINDKINYRNLAGGWGFIKDNSLEVYVDFKRIPFDRLRVGDRFIYKQRKYLRIKDVYDATRTTVIANCVCFANNTAERLKSEVRVEVDV